MCQSWSLEVGWCAMTSDSGREILTVDQTAENTPGLADLRLSYDSQGRIDSGSIRQILAHFYGRWPSSRPDPQLQENTVPSG